MPQLWASSSGEEGDSTICRRQGGGRGEGTSRGFEGTRFRKNPGVLTGPTAALAKEQIKHPKLINSYWMIIILYIPE